MIDGSKFISGPTPGLVCVPAGVVVADGEALVLPGFMVHVTVLEDSLYVGFPAPPELTYSAFSGIVSVTITLFGPPLQPTLISYAMSDGSGWVTS